MVVSIPRVGCVEQSKVHFPGHQHALVRQQPADGGAKRQHVERASRRDDPAGGSERHPGSVDHGDGKRLRHRLRERRCPFSPLALPLHHFHIRFKFDNIADNVCGFLQCQFIQWLEGTFMKNASNAKITHYAYNEHLGTLLSGATMTNSGSA